MGICLACASQIQCRDAFGRGDSFVQKITGIVDRPLQRIREFRNRPNPGVVVSVDLMSTGVDIPDLEYIVFLRPVKSRILFEQMIYPMRKHGFTDTPALIHRQRTMLDFWKRNL